VPPEGLDFNDAIIMSEDIAPVFTLWNYSE
jgi:hypothetical protein